MMFKNCSVMVISTDEFKIMRLEIDNETQEEICNKFEKSMNSLISNKEKIEFDGNYKPETDELLYINNFQLPDEIKAAISNPLGVSAYEKIGKNYPRINAIFIGVQNKDRNNDNFTVAFQKFKKEQYIANNFLNIFITKNTFRREKKFGIGISDCVDCVYTSGELQFKSFYFARQIFDLKEYYRLATEQEVKAFTSNEHLIFENANEFELMANQQIRRKIAMINDSNVLTNYSPEKIKDLAKQAGIDITVNNKSIIIPNDKARINIILSFLDEEAYKGPFSDATYVVNSKKQVKINNGQK